MDIHEDAYIAEGVKLVGENISIGKDSSVWFNSVIRCSGDESVTIGERTNIQDLSMIHTSGGHPVKIGDGVTAGHMCLLHGCTIGDNTLIGMGSIIMDGAEIGSGCIVGAGSLVTSGMKIPDGCMAFGRPAKKIKDLSEEEIAWVGIIAEKYTGEKEEVKHVCDDH